MIQRSLCVLGALAILAASPTGGRSASARECGSVAGMLIAAEGQVQYRDGTVWSDAGQGLALCDRDAVRTGADSRAAIRLVDDAVLRLDQNTTLVLSDVSAEPEERSLLSLVVGAIQSFSRRPQELEVDTPYLNATIEGTEFALRVGPEAASLTVLEGSVLAKNPFGSASVPGGGAVVANKGSAPRAVALAEPRDAVEWALYYPPVGIGEGSDPGSSLGQAARLRADGRTDSAIALLRAAPGGDTGAELYLASLLLEVGRSDEAAALLDAILAREPQNGLALAQSAIIDVATNAPESADAKARAAVAAAPDEAAPYIALSYAEQSRFALEDARATLEDGAARVPDSALIHARLAEVWLALGYRKRSLEAAGRALALDPDLERAHVMQGFAALTAHDTVAAAAAFEQAIALAPADPQPRLGLGLAKIRDGAIEEGRAEIDAAVALDANRSLYRSYLGKGYFAEDRNELAAAQFAIAKELDPLDPTPYLYDAIRLQTENRPGEALHALQQSAERNDNRAVYRGQLLLDSDEAARGASLGRIYQDLGFTTLGQRAATNSLALDPANASAHRFLADLYRGERRRELARVSELLKSQLLQDVTLNPIQPSMTETNLNLVAAGGPTDAGFNEFTSLFASDGFRFTGTGQLGTDDTWGGEMGFAIKHGNASLSVSGFEFRTDGFRENFDADHSIYDIFAQIAVTPELNLQAEVRVRDSEFGDLALNFDPDVFEAGLRQTYEEQSARFGARYSPDPNNDTLLSVIFVESEAGEMSDFGGGFSLDASAEGDGWQAELQHIWQSGGLSLTAGASHSRFDDVQAFDFFFEGEPFFSLPPGDVKFTDTRFYAYGTAEFDLPAGLGDMALTLGASYTSTDQDDKGLGAKIAEDSLDPKLGVIWNVTDDLSLRAAYLEVVKPPLVTNRTIEPTQVAGFNQFYDDFNATSSKLAGVGIDYRISDRAFVGASSVWRELESPVFDSDENGFFVNQTDWSEETHRAYLNLLPHPRVPVSLEVVYDRFEADSSFLTLGGETPLEVETLSVPLSVRYYDPSGFFAGVQGTYVNQSVSRENADFGDGDSSFFNVDVAAGYRFAKQRGSASIQVRNLLDNEFDYQDDGFREISNTGATGPYFPSLSILGQVTINF